MEIKDKQIDDMPWASVMAVCKLLRLPAEMMHSDGRPWSYWLGRQADEMTGLPPGVRRSRNPIVNAVSKWASKGQLPPGVQKGECSSNGEKEEQLRELSARFVQPRAVLCDVHEKGLNPWLIRALFVLLANEVTVRSDRIRTWNRRQRAKAMGRGIHSKDAERKPGSSVDAYNDDHPTSAIAAGRWVGRMDDANALWMDRECFDLIFRSGAEAEGPGAYDWGHRDNPNYETYDRPEDVALPPRVPSRCEACILAVVGCRRRLLVDLKAGMVARSGGPAKCTPARMRENERQREKGWRRRNEGTSDRPRLERFVDAWLYIMAQTEEDQGTSQTDLLAESMILGDLLYRRRKLIRSSDERRRRHRYREKRQRRTRYWSDGDSRRGSRKDEARNEARADGRGHPATPRKSYSANAGGRDVTAAADALPQPPPVPTEKPRRLLKLAEDGNPYRPYVFPDPTVVSEVHGDSPVLGDPSSTLHQSSAPKNPISTLHSSASLGTAPDSYSNPTEHGNAEIGSVHVTDYGGPASLHHSNNDDRQSHYSSSSYESVDFDNDKSTVVDFYAAAVRRGNGRCKTGRDGKVTEKGPASAAPSSIQQIMHPAFVSGVSQLSALPRPLFSNKEKKPASRQTSPSVRFHVDKASSSVTTPRDPESRHQKAAYADSWVTVTVHTADDSDESDANGGYGNSSDCDAEGCDGPSETSLLKSQDNSKTSSGKNMLYSTSPPSRNPYTFVEDDEDALQALPTPKALIHCRPSDGNVALITTGPRNPDLAFRDPFSLKAAPWQHQDHSGGDRGYRLVPRPSQTSAQLSPLDGTRRKKESTSSHMLGVRKKKDSTSDRTFGAPKGKESTSSRKLEVPKHDEWSSELATVAVDVNDTAAARQSTISAAKQSPAIHCIPSSRRPHNVNANGVSELDFEDSETLLAMCRELEADYARLESLALGTASDEEGCDLLLEPYVEVQPDEGPSSLRLNPEAAERIRRRAERRRVKAEEWARKKEERRRDVEKRERIRSERRKRKLDGENGRRASLESKTTETTQWRDLYRGQ